MYDINIIVDTRATSVTVMTDEKLIMGAVFLPGGMEFLETFLKYLKEERFMLVNRLSAERVLNAPADCQTNIKGRSTKTGYPAQFDISGEEAVASISHLLDGIVSTIKRIYSVEIAPLIHPHNLGDCPIFVRGDYKYIYVLPE